MGESFAAGELRTVGTAKVPHEGIMVISLDVLRNEGFSKMLKLQSTLMTIRKA